MKYEKEIDKLQKEFSNLSIGIGIGIIANATIKHLLILLDNLMDKNEALELVNEILRIFTEARKQIIKDK